MTAVIYARYSSDSQREASIEGQLRDCKDYAEKNGITVVGTYIDRAYSAKTDDRPDFQRMIKDSAKKIFDVVLVWKLDRFARNRFDAVNYKYQLEKNGVHLVSAMEPISQGPEGIMVESMLIGMAEYYSAELALKVARGERENALQCKYNGGIVPLGFTIGKEDRLYHIDPETAPIVQEIFTRYANGEPAEKIAASLNERGLRTRTGKPFVKNSFFQIFRNRRYIGEYRYKDIVTPGGIPAIVDEDLFNRVQQRFEQNKIAHGRPAKEDVSYLLTTKLFCGKCGTLMGGESGTSHMGNTYYYYKCGKAKRHGKAHCDLKAIRKEPLERFVVETAIKVIFSDEIIERLIDLIMEAQQQENTRLPVLKDQLRDTEKRLANLLEAIEQGILTPTTKQRLDELEARKEALNTSILEEELKKPVLTREWMRFWFEKFRKGDMRDMEHQRQIIDTFVNSVYVFDDRVVLNFNFTDDSKTISREEVLGSSAVDNAPPDQRRPCCVCRIQIALWERSHRVFHPQPVDGLVVCGVRSIQNVVSLFVITRRIHRIAILIEVRRRKRIAAAAHGGACFQVGPQRREHRAVALQVQPGSRVVVRFHHTEERLVQCVGGAELALCRIELRRQQQDVPFCQHLCGQVQQRQRIRIGKDSYVCHPVRRERRFQRFAVIAEPRRGAGEEHQLFLPDKTAQPVVFIRPAALVAAAVDRRARRVDVQGVQRRASLERIVRDVAQGIKQGDLPHCAARERPRFDRAQTYRKDDLGAGCPGKRPGGDAGDGQPVQLCRDDQLRTAATPSGDGHPAAGRFKAELFGRVPLRPLRIESAFRRGAAAQPHRRATAVRRRVPAGQGVARPDKQGAVRFGVPAQMRRRHRDFRPRLCRIARKKLPTVGIVIQMRLAPHGGHTDRRGITHLRQGEGVALRCPDEFCIRIIRAGQGIAVYGQKPEHRPSAFRHGQRIAVCRECL